MIKIKPIGGSTLRDPNNKSFVIPSEGAEVPDTPYWRRRISEGSAEIVKEHTKKPEKKEIEKQ